MWAHVIRYGRRAIGLVMFVSLPMAAWMWMVAGFGFTADHGSPQVAQATGIDAAYLECAAETLEQIGAPGRLSAIGFSFESLYGRDDAFIVRAPFQRTVVEVTDNGDLVYESRFGEEEVITVSCAGSLAADPTSSP